jgi:hypothetical protein
VGALFTSAVNAQLLAATNPTLAITDLTTPAANSLRDDVVFFLNSNSISGAKFTPAPMRVFLPAGTSLTLTSGTQMTAILYVVDLIVTISATSDHVV